MAEYTEDCCFNDIRDRCPLGIGSCPCRCTGGTVIFLQNADGSISVDGGVFSEEADFDVMLLGRADPDLLETTIRVKTREGVAIYVVDGAQPLGAPSLHGRLLRVER